MNKLKVLWLCLMSAVLGVLGTSYISNPSLWATSAQSVEIDGPSSVSLGDIVEYTAKVDNPSWFLSKTVFQWQVLLNHKEVNFRSLSDEDIIFAAGNKPVTYTVVVNGTGYYNYFFWAIVSPLNTTVKTVIVKPDVPPPNPVPPVPPTPVPPVPPVTQKLFCMAIFDNTMNVSLPAGQLALHNSNTIKDALSALNVVWRNMDKNDPALADPSWQSNITKVGGLPTLFIVDPTGKPYFIGPLPASEADLLTQVKKLRGN